MQAPELPRAARPTMVLPDRQGMVRRQLLRSEQDMVVGAEIMDLVCEDP